MQVKKINESPYFDREGNKQNFENHYNKHVLGIGDYADNERYLLKGLSEDEYDELANEVSESPAGPLNSSTSDVVGYVTKDGRIVKYRFSDNLLVIYIKDKKGDKDQSLALYKVNRNKFYNKFLNHPKYGYFDELPENKKLSNTINKIENDEELTLEDLDGLDLKTIEEELQHEISIYSELNESVCDILLKNKKLVKNLREEI